VSKLALRKAIADFDAPQLRELLMDIYTRSREAKELLDFYATPDVDKKFDEYKKLIDKEVYRIKRRRPAPRMREIRAAIRKFARLEPGDEAVGQLMAETVIELCNMAKSTFVDDKLAEQTDRLFADTLEYLKARRMAEDYGFRFRKAIESIRPEDRYCLLRRLLASTLRMAFPDMPD
jgi:hypothetical protein